MIGTATPKTDENKAKMRAKTGRDHFNFAAIPVRCQVAVPGRGDVPALRWDFTALDPLLRVALCYETSRARHISTADADVFLRQRGVYFVEAELALSYADDAGRPVQ